MLRRAWIIVVLPLAMVLMAVCSANGQPKPDVVPAGKPVAEKPAEVKAGTDAIANEARSRVAEKCAAATKAIIDAEKAAAQRAEIQNKLTEAIEASVKAANAEGDAAAKGAAVTSSKAPAKEAFDKFLDALVSEATAQKQAEAAVQQFTTTAVNSASKDLINEVVRARGSVGFVAEYLKSSNLIDDKEAKEIVDRHNAAAKVAEEAKAKEKPAASPASAPTPAPAPASK